MVLQRISVETTVNAPIEQVWNAYTTPEDIKQWNTASDDWHTTASSVDLRVGGAFSSRMEARDGSMGFDFAGTYTGNRERTSSSIMRSAIDRSRRVHPRQGWRPGARDLRRGDRELHRKQRGGWQAILDNFARHVENNR